MEVKKGEKIRVYVIHTLYSGGDPIINARKAIDMATALLDDGFVPFIPHLNIFWHLIHPRDQKVWEAWDLEWLPVCHAILRVPGPSTGGDKEEARGVELELPVFYDKEKLVEWRTKILQTL